MKNVKVCSIYLVGGIALTLNSCAIISDNYVDNRDFIPSSSTTFVGLKSMVLSNKSSAINPNSAWQPTIAVSVYKVDKDCHKLVAEKVSIPAKEPLKYVVDQVLFQPALSDLNLAGYHLVVNSQDQTASVDLQMNQEERRLSSMSRCEMLALFGSLRQTLTANPALHIKNVRFSKLGEEVLVTLQE